MKNRILTNLYDPKRRRLVQSALLVALVVAMSLSAVVFGKEEGEVSSAVKTLMNSFYGEIIKTAVYVVPGYIGVVAIMMLAGGRNAWEKFRSGIITAAVVLVVIYAAPLIVTTIIDQVSGLTGVGKLGFDGLDPKNAG